MTLGTSVRAIGLELFALPEHLRTGAPIFVLGFPLGLRSTMHTFPVARSGIIARAPGDDMIADVLVFPGSSGSPALYVPPFKTPGVSFGGLPMVNHELLVGLVTSFIPYQEPAISPQTQRVRVMFEENSGLARLVPAPVIRAFIEGPEVLSFESSLD